ncbi:MAG: hybrid sensor histidine kinase/response regulator [Bacteroidetes bacterium]|jgi:two-component system sensor histidine kinase/response regulator|nr:hybrid sensor histidine kinase/response regulator [Bacteroidota bacterium]
MIKHLNILLVEDNPGDAMLIEELLLESNQFDFNITHAETLKAGLYMVEKDEYDIILLDLGLPDSQGLEALETMLKKAYHLPVVVITGLDDNETGRKAINMGAQSYIIKGLNNARALSNTIMHAIERNKILLELKAKDAEMKKINARLQEANNAKERLIALLSHDLRGPVKNIVTLLELLLDDFNEFDDEKKKKILMTCVKSGQSTEELLETLLDWARLQSDEKKIHPQQTALKTFIDESIEPVLAMAVQKNISFSNQTIDDQLFYADKDMIATVLRNLLSNAIKFTPQNGSIAIKSERPINGGVKIAVEDTGVGIKEEDINKIFDITEGFTTPGTDKEKGSGFGMILCKEFVEKNNGKLYIESKKGKGTTVSFVLPMFP